MKNLAKRQMFNKIENLMNFKSKASGVPSWIRYLKSALGMTTAQLAERMNIATPSLYQLERQEASDKATLQSLRKAADAMECDLIYTFVPRRPLKDIIEEQAYKRAKETVLSANLHMEYEDQAISKKELQKQIYDLAEVLKSSKQLWSNKSEE